MVRDMNTMKDRCRYLRITEDGEVEDDQYGYSISGFGEDRRFLPTLNYALIMKDEKGLYDLLAVLTDFEVYVVGFPDPETAKAHRDCVLSEDDPRRSEPIDGRVSIYVDSRYGSDIEVHLSEDVELRTIADIAEMFANMCPDGAMDMTPSHIMHDVPDDFMLTMLLSCNSAMMAEHVHENLLPMVDGMKGVMRIDRCGNDGDVCGTFVAWTGVDMFTVCVTEWRRHERHDTVQQGAQGRAERRPVVRQQLRDLSPDREEEEGQGQRHILMVPAPGARGAEHEHSEDGMSSGNKMR